MLSSHSTLRRLLAIMLVAGLPAFGFSQGGFLDGLRNQVQSDIGGAVQQFGAEIRGGFNPTPAPPPPTSGQPQLRSLPGESGRNNTPGNFFNPQPGFNQPNYGQPNYGQPNYGQPNYGQPSQGQPNYGQPTTGQPYYGQPNTGQPSYGQPSYGQPGTTLPSSSTPSYSQPPLRSDTHNGQAINVRCPKGNDVTINYELIVDGKPYPYSMGPGQKQTFNDTQLWLIRYDSAGSKVTYRLVGGNNYEFDRDAQGNPQLYRGEQYAEPPTRR